MSALVAFGSGAATRRVALELAPLETLGATLVSTTATAAPLPKPAPANRTATLPPVEELAAAPDDGAVPFDVAEPPPAPPVAAPSSKRPPLTFAAVSNAPLPVLPPAGPVRETASATAARKPAQVKSGRLGQKKRYANRRRDDRSGLAKVHAQISDLFARVF